MMGIVQKDGVLKSAPADRHRAHISWTQYIRGEKCACNVSTGGDHTHHVPTKKMLFIILA